MKKILVEFIGTFFLTVTVGSVVLLGTGSPPFAPFAIAAVLMVMIYAGGHISGAHYNPAVSLAVYLRGRSTLQDLLSYILTQIAAALAAVVVARALVPGEPVSALKLATTPTLIAEFLFTFALAWVVLNVATAKATSGNSYFGIAIGFTVLAGAIAVGGISGGAFNPAVSTLLMVLGKLHIVDCWLHLLPQILGAIAAAYAFKATHPEDR